MITDHKDVIVLVSAYSTGRFLPLLFRGYGYSCIHIMAHPHLEDNYAIGYNETKSLYLEDIPYSGSLNDIYEKLASYHVKCVVPGSESGVQLADLLSEGLKLKISNSTRLSEARRDKYLMQQTLATKGINHIPSCLISHFAEAESFIAKYGYPLVVKPLSSSDAEGVTFCADNNQLSNAIDNLLQKKNLYDVTVDKLILQKQMVGDEFVVNTVSYDGKHFVTDMWSNQKTILNNGSSAYDYQDFIPANEINFKILEEYVHKVLDAMEIKFGAAHCELVVSGDGPVLIEIGARLSGAFDSSATMTALGYSQASKLVESYLNPTKFNDDLTPHVIPHKKIRIVSLISNAEGVMADIGHNLLVKDINSFHSIQHDFVSGSYLNKTTGLTNSPGNIYLISDSIEMLENDYKKIRHNEKTFYNSIVQHS